MVQDKGKLVHAHPANELTEKHFGFESVIAKRKSGNAVYANFSVDSDDVPEGKIWKITHICAWNEDGDIATRCGLKLYHDGFYIYIHRKEGSTARYESIDKHVELYLDVNDYIKAEFEGVASPETCHLDIFGYEMNVP